MFTNAKLALCVAAVLGGTSAAQTAPQRPTIRQTESIAQHQVSRSVSGDDSFAPAPGQSTRANAVYFDPSPAPFNAFTYCASVTLARGYVVSLSRPGGNVTGIFVHQVELAAKRIEIAREAFPRATVVGIAFDTVS